MKSDFTGGFRDTKVLEKYSSAFTISDMEVFIFPDLFYPLVLANIMSPIIWNWRDDPWFENIEKKSFNYKVNRIKQYIIQNYVFNLDLSTWGLTTKSREIERFREFFDMETLKQSNALFGYEGDKYYFDIDIRKHFGLDKYTTDVIPYWKTETVEAMTAFRHRENFFCGAGECVSLSALYAAAMFIIGRIPLEKIFLIATPLHSQNFIIEKEGLITNNRRIVTKNMWFNGTSLSEKARRALENEKVTIVTHLSGFIHTIYREATIDKSSYEHFATKLRSFLKTDITDLIFINFLRFKSGYKSLFQYRCDCSGIRRFISLEKMFEYEHTSRFSVSAEARQQLVGEIEGDEFHLSPLPGKIMLNDIERLFVNGRTLNIDSFSEELLRLAGESSVILPAELIQDLHKFTVTEPRLPGSDKTFTKTTRPDIKTSDDREEIIRKISEITGSSETALLSLYIYRQMDRIDWIPFIKASIERNPVCCTALEGKSVGEVYDILNRMPDESIYDGVRMSLPDEVWNFSRGDGAEKAFLLADFIISKDNSTTVEIKLSDGNAVLYCDSGDYSFKTSKPLKRLLRISGKNYSDEIPE